MNPPITQSLLSQATWLPVAAAALLGLAWTPSSASAQSPGLEAVEAFKEGRAPRPAVENRFFRKEGRLEISPMFGYVPNNPFARRFVGAATLGYHFSEAWSVQVNVQYSPDLEENDLKDLTSILLQRAQDQSACNQPNATANCGSEDFRQPLDKVVLGASLGVAWAPVYGKINLVGETVLNFDFYLFGGVGMVSKNDYAATYDDSNLANDPNDVVSLNEPISSVLVGPYVGLGQNYFVNQTIAIKLDLRMAFYVDDAPRYDPDAEVNQRLYNNLVAGVGVALFFPKMKPRLYNF